MAQAKPKLLFVISHELFVRNYIRSKIIEQIATRYEVSVIASKESALKEDIEATKGFAGYFSTDPETHALHYRYFTLLIFRYKKRSKTFMFRLKREIGWSLPSERWHHLKNFLILLKGRKGKKSRYCLLRANPIIFNFWKPRLEKAIPISMTLRSKIREIQPDILLFPSSAYDPVGNDVARICSDSGIKSVYLIDNWDNLSSKSVFWAPPNFLGVWSEQHKEHAICIHEFNPESIFPIGTARFENYFVTRGRTASKLFEFPYVVFSGCCLPFDETTPLKALDAELRCHPEIYGDLRIVYRPHPWRQKRKYEEDFKEDDFTHVIIDPQIREQFLKNGNDMSGRTSFQPRTDYYPLLLENTEFVCGPLTTFLIESLIFTKDYIGLSYDDGIHITSPHNAFKYYEMYKGIDQHPGVHLVHKQNQLVESFRTTFKFYQKDGANRANWDNALSHFLRIDEQSYLDRITDLIDKVHQTPIPNKTKL